MLPIWHVIYGAVFTAVLWFAFPHTDIWSHAYIFLASVLIDIDHYIAAGIKLRTMSLKKTYHHYKNLMPKQIADAKRGIYNRGDFHIFHTVEFLSAVLILGLFYMPFFYIFIGMAFHSLLDVYSLLKDNTIHVREYFFVNWIRKHFKNSK